MNLVSDVVESELKGVRICVDSEDLLEKTAVTHMERTFLRNEARMLTHMQASCFTPVPHMIQEDERCTALTEEYLGESEPVTDEVIFRRECALLLLMLRDYGVIHGDLTSKNIIVRNNRPMVVDWHQSRLINDPGPDKRPEGDAYHLWRAAAELSPDTSRHLRKWLAIRPYVQDGSLLDLGCADGDYCLFALAEKAGRAIHGVDKDRKVYRRALSWSGIFRDLFFFHQSIDKWNPESPHYDTIFMMSVYPYMTEDYGRDRAAQLVRKAVGHSDQLFFETQLHGDGPGPKWFQTDYDVEKWLAWMGKVEQITTIPVHGRDASRTIWRVT